MKNLAKFFLFVFLGSILFPAIYLYLTKLTDVALWLWAWLFVFSCAAYFNFATETKGLIILLVSVTFGVLGPSLFNGPQYDNGVLTVEILSQIMIVMGAGVGSNLISHVLLLDRKQGTSRNAARQRR